ncbi:(2Fe-2S)-binding protein [Amycolatopsis sp. PS_44_ISF1]|uniref:(2Fe-2S)-binding protein n=1 Tax=Amycolatopsis sp. PS_44_ISF1 TaxID=2974917 RepID=UPI0028DE6144|nr:(2Fe-2S)-binding protein [Amycolatopsis sp. PS_44_ISF1]MDT8913376.1 (2Fe-2S)-binding protein [Amycolatopsis sp. PS_44_ISF1]
MTGDLTGLGPFFAVHTHASDAGPTPPWHPLDELVSDEDVLGSRIASVRTALAGGRPDDAVEWRVAASVTHLGLVARLLSPALAFAVRDATVLGLDPATTWWEPVPGGAVPLSVRPPPGPPEPDGALVDALAEQVLDGPIRLLTGLFPVPGTVGWGNVASAVNGAATMLGTDRPEWTDRAQGLAAALLGRTPLRSTSTRVDGRFRRRSCCLIYRAAPSGRGGVCGDCVLTGS